MPNSLKCRLKKLVRKGFLTEADINRIIIIPVNEGTTRNWIPVSERLPKDEDYVLVCYANGNIRTAYYYIDTTVYDFGFEDLCETGWYNYNEDFMYDQDVVAWMPLPKPYKAESEVKNEVN